MPLPQQVIEQLSKDSEKAPGWSFGILLFSGGILALVIAAYFGLTLAYGPYLNTAIAAVKGQISTVTQSISSSDQVELLNYYSEIGNLDTVIKSHVVFSPFMNWLEANTEANVSYGTMNFSSGNQVTLTAFAKTQADVNEQIAIFESSPQIAAVSVPDVAFSPTAGMWSFTVTLTLNQSLLLWQSTTTGMTSTAPTSTTFATTAAIPTPTSSALSTSTP